MPSCLTPSVFGSLGSYFRTALGFGLGPGVATELGGGGPPAAASIGHEQRGGGAGKVTHPISHPLAKGKTNHQRKGNFKMYIL